MKYHGNTQLIVLWKINHFADKSTVSFLSEILLWVGRRSKGVCCYDGNSFAIVLQNGIFDEFGAGPMAEDKAGNIWFGTEPGDMTMRETTGVVWRYNPPALKGGAGTFTNFTTKDGLANNSVFCVLTATSGKLWFGTRGMGLSCYDGEIFTRFPEEYQHSATTDPQWPDDLIAH